MFRAWPVLLRNPGDEGVAALRFRGLPPEAITRGSAAR